MAEYINETFEGVTIHLDGNSFKKCTFKNCTIIYQAMEAKITVNGCSFADCQWQFDGAAARTVKHMAWLYAQGGNFPDLIEATFASVRGTAPSGETLH